MTRDSSPAPIRLNKDLVREIKRGHAWLYSHAVEQVDLPAGSIVTVLDRKGEKRIATGICDPAHPIPVRICRTQPPFQLDDKWLAKQLDNASRLRSSCFDQRTTGYRLVAGEGDGLPGLIIDVYDRTAVIKLDGGAPEAFYQSNGIAQWLREESGIERVVQRFRERGRAGQELLTKETPSGQPETTRSAVPFLENGMHFTADVLQGQKTGFFLDQRDNRNIVRQFAKNKSVLNLFAFNGGFSIAAGIGGADHVTSVDIAKPAIAAAGHHWVRNDLDLKRHLGVTQDCFNFLESAAKNRQTWDIVICDPPSFAPNEKSRPQAVTAYGRLTQLAAKVTKSYGLLAVASCSSHIDHRAFVEIISDALGRTRRKANLLVGRGLPMDHPTPLAMPELRYLKFFIFQLD